MRQPEQKGGEKSGVVEVMENQRKKGGGWGGEMGMGTPGKKTRKNHKEEEYIYMHIYIFNT